MSAFIVSTYHINALVSFATSPGTIPAHARDPVQYIFNGALLYLRPQHAASVLYAQNVRSVNARYRENEPDREIHFTRINTSHLTPADIVKACDCLSYQSCETDDWEMTEAYVILDAIRTRAVRELCKGSTVWALDAPVHATV